MKNWFRRLPQALARSGQRHKGLKYPINLLLFLMAAVCRGTHAAGTMARPAIRRRVLAAALTVCMVLTMMPIQTFAAEPTRTVGELCEHHLTHTAECGYTEGTAGSPCTYQCEICNPAEEDAKAPMPLTAAAPPDNSWNIGDSYSGNAEDVTASLADGILTIEGNGEMRDLGSSAPWDDSASQIKEVTVSSGVISISQNAFYNCTAITSVELYFSNENPKKFINPSSFSSDLTAGKITVIAEDASPEIFKGWDSSGGMMDATFTDSTAATTTLTGKPDQTYITASYGTADKGWEIGGSGNLTISTADGMADWVTNGLAANKTTVKTVTIAEAVTSIPIKAFDGCKALTSVSAPSVTFIENYAFNTCKMLTSVNFPNVTTIDCNVFENCTALTSVNFPEVTTIGDSAFYNCTLLTSVTAPKVTTIGKSAFTYCTALESVSFLEVTTISESAFYSCNRLTSVSFPAVTSIGRYAFQSCAALTTLKLPAAPPSVSNANAFADCPADRELALVDENGSALTGDALTTAQAEYDKVVSPDTGTDTDGLWFGWKVEESAVDKGWTIDAQNNLTISSAAGMTDWLQNGHSSHQRSIKTATIDKAVAAIETAAFYECTALENVTANGATTIGYSVFSGCTKLATLTLGATPPTVRSADTFINCPTPRVLNLVDADGNPLTDTALINAQKAYDDVTADGNQAGDSLWYGWKIDATPPTTPTVTSVAVTPKTANVQKGKTQQFTAAVTGTNSPAQTVTWTVTGGKTGTNISIGGLLTVAADETAATLTVTATSTVDTTKSGTATATVTTAPTTPTVTSVAVTPQTASVQEGKTQQFIAAVTGTNSPAQTVTWTVTGGKTGTNISAGGLLTVAADETAATLTVTATSTVDTTKSGTATATVTSTPVMKYTLTVTNGTGGGNFEAGASVTVTANSPAQGKVFDQWTTTDGVSFADAASATTTIIMPNKAVSVTAIYKDVGASTYELSVNGSYAQTTGTGSYAAGTAVTISAGTRSDYSFSGWSSVGGGTFANANSTTTTFTMPANAAAVTASWTKNGSGGGSSSGGSGGGSTTKPSTPDQTNPSKGESTVTAPVDGNGNASVTVTDKNINDAIKEAKKDAAQGQPISVSIKVETDKAATQITATLPKTVQEKLISSKVDSVTIASNTVTMSFSQTAIQQMNGQAKADITITAAKVDTGRLTGDAKSLIGNRPMYDFTATYGGNKTITNFGNNTVSIAIPYTLGTGETAGNIQAVYVDDNGKATAIPNSSYDAAQKAVIFVTSHFSGYGVGYRQTATVFTDIANHWAKADVEFVASRGLLTGTGKNTFTPDTAMTRSMFVTALGRLAGVDGSSYKTGRFTDVKADAYYAPYANWAADKGIVSGTTDTAFAPDQSITRQEMAVIMTNYAKAMGYSVPKTREAVPFMDNSSIASWAKDAVKTMQMAGVMNGKDGNRFDPTGTATRAEVSAVFHRYVELAIDPATAQGWDKNDSGV